MTKTRSDPPPESRPVLRRAGVLVPDRHRDVLLAVFNTLAACERSGRPGIADAVVDEIVRAIVDRVGSSIADGPQAIPVSQVDPRLMPAVFDRTGGSTAPPHGDADFGERGVGHRTRNRVSQPDGESSPDPTAPGSDSDVDTPPDDGWRTTQDQRDYALDLYDRLDGKRPLGRRTLNDPRRLSAWIRSAKTASDASA